MRGTTQDRVHGDDPADRLTQMLLQGRDVLPHALNGRPIPPSDPRAANIRREMQQGRSKEFHRLRTVMQCDLTDGVPFALVVAPLRQMIADLEVFAVDRHRARVVRPIPALVRAETKAQAALDLAQLRAVESPTSAAILDEVLYEAGRYEAALADLTTACRQQLAVVQGKPRKVFGARRGLEVMR